MNETGNFKLGSLDHVHVYVPDKHEAAKWYSQVLGFEPIEKTHFWSDGSGPLTISADHEKTGIAKNKPGNPDKTR